MGSGLTIGQLSKTVGVSIQTVRYYERRALLEPAGRRPSGYRVYGNDAIRRLQFIRNAQGFGFTLHEIAELLNLRVSANARCRDVKRGAQVKLDQVTTKIQHLQALAEALRHLVHACRTGEPTDRCFILNHIQEQSDNRNVKANRT